MSALPVPHEEQEQAQTDGPKWRLKALSPWHKQVCSLLAQGIPRGTIAQIMDCTPEYVSMLARQPLIQEYIKDWCAYAGLQLEAQFVQTVEVIGETMANGTYKEKLQAAELQAKLTGRIGSGSGQPQEQVDMPSRLVSLSERLVGLLESQKMAHDAKVIEGEFNEHEKGEDVSDAQYHTCTETEASTGQLSHESAQGNGRGEESSQES